MSIFKHFSIATVITAVLSAPSTITVTWNALPLTEYCVDINKTTLDSTETVALDSVSVCGLANQHIFTYSNLYSNRSVCDRFSFTVTPDGEMRGTTSEPVTGFFTRAESMYGALLVYALLNCAGSGGRHRIRDNGENKSVEFEATVSIITSCCVEMQRYTCY